MKANNIPNVSDLSRWIDLQLSTIIDGVSSGYTLGNGNTVWIDKGATVFSVSLANGETFDIDSDKYNTAEEIANAIISNINETTPSTKNPITMKIGSINAAMPMALYNKRGKLIGWCADTPNAFACACQLRADVCKGIANYPYFGETTRERDSEDNASRMLWDNTTLANSVKFN